MEREDIMAKERKRGVQLGRDRGEWVPTVIGREKRASKVATARRASRSGGGTLGPVARKQQAGGEESP